MLVQVCKTNNNHKLNEYLYLLWCAALAHSSSDLVWRPLSSNFLFSIYEIVIKDREREREWDEEKETKHIWLKSTAAWRICSHGISDLNIHWVSCTCTLGWYNFFFANPALKWNYELVLIKWWPNFKCIAQYFRLFYFQHICFWQL